MHLACLRDRAECCELLLSLGASLAAADVGWPPCLFNHGFPSESNVMRLQKDGNSPLHVAAMAGSMQCLRLFLARAADFELTNKVTDSAALGGPMLRG